jgi:RNA polymerase sigma-70 factor, ECF subfamily
VVQDKHPVSTPVLSRKRRRPMRLVGQPEGSPDGPPAPSPLAGSPRPASVLPSPSRPSRRPGGATGRQSCAPVAPHGDFEVIYSRYFNQLCSYLQRILRDQHTAEEVCQQTFIRVWRALPRFRANSVDSLESWLYTIAHRCALSELKKRHDDLSLDPARVKATDSFDVSRRRVSHWLLNEDFAHLFGQLALAQRQVLTLRYLFDMSCAETAHVLGRSTTNVTSLEHRARRALAEDAAGTLKLYSA